MKTHRTPLVAVIAVLAVCGGLPALSQGDGIAVVDLGTLGGSYSTARSVNEACAVAGDAATSNGWHAFHWQADVMTDLGEYQAGAGSVAHALNIHGAVVGESAEHAVLWENGSIISMVYYPEGGTTTYDINDSRQVVGTTYHWMQDRYAAWVWQNGSFTELPTLPGGYWAGARAIDQAGNVVGWGLLSGGWASRAILWQGGGASALPTLGGDSAGAYDINASGHIVGWSSTAGSGDECACSWQGGGITNLGALAGPAYVRSEAFALNSDDWIVGYVATPDREEHHAALWRHGAFINLDALRAADSPWAVLREAYDINDQGWIVGEGVLQTGEWHGFLLKVGTLDLLDPNPALMSNGTVSSDPAVLNSGAGRLVDGLAADGVTRLVIKAEAEGPGPVEVSIRDENGATAGVGTLSTPGGSEALTTLPVSVVELGGRYWAFAILTAPADFVRDAADEPLAERPLVVSMTYPTSQCGTTAALSRNIKLRRPPVALLHGLWSDADTWQWPLLADARFSVHAQDYRGTHAAWFRRNVVQARAAVASAVQRLRDQNFACTQADFFGHSMGGLLGRMYVANSSGTYLRNDNFLQGDIHKLVTVNTPHRGSPLANVLVGADNQPTWAGWALNGLGKPVNRGAVHDLRPDSPVLTALPAASVPAHVIVGKGGSDILQAGLEATLPLAQQALLRTLRFFGLFPEDIFGPGLQHDLVVGRLSQEGGLGTDSPQTSVFEFWDGLHMTVTGRPAVGARAVELLNAAVTDTSVFAAGFPAASFRSAEAVSARSAPARPARDGGIQISSPLSGTHVAPRASITVTVEASGGFVPTRALLVSSDEAAVIDETAPFELLLDISSNAIGTVEVTAFAIDAAESVAVSPPILLIVDVGAALTGLTTAPNPCDLFAYAPQQALSVVGHFADGVERTLGGSASGTSYASANPAIATVDAAGNLTAHGVGETTVTVSNGGFENLVAVKVHSIPGDVDRDGDVDLTDQAGFISCLAGPDVLPSPATPRTVQECLDAFDFDGEADVDLADFARLQVLLGAP